MITIDLRVSVEFELRVSYRFYYFFFFTFEMISVICLGLERVPQERTRYLSRSGFEKVPHGADWGI